MSLSPPPMNSFSTTAVWEKYVSEKHEHQEEMEAGWEEERPRNRTGE